MSHSHRDESFSDDLQRIADVLRDERPALDPLTLDRVKLRAMSGAHESTSPRAKGPFMRSRLTALVTAGFLTLGTGGALALAGGYDGAGAGGSASFHQYRPPCDHGQGRGRDHECHGHEGEHGGGNPGEGGDHGHDGGSQGGGDQGGGGSHGGGDHGHDGGGSHGHH
jgi:hypothetical protein